MSAPICLPYTTPAMGAPPSAGGPSGAGSGCGGGSCGGSGGGGGCDGSVGFLPNQNQPAMSGFAGGIPNTGGGVGPNPNCILIVDK